MNHSWLLWFSLILNFKTEHFMVVAQQYKNNILQKTVATHSELLWNMEIKLKQVNEQHPSSLSAQIHLAELMINKNFREVVNFGRNRYLLSTYSVSSFFAKYLCSVYRGYLLEINDEEEYDEMKKLAEKHELLGVHIGMDDLDVERKWVYSYSKTPAFTKYSEKEPNGGAEENCGQLTKQWNYLMADVRCTANLPFICEIPNVN